MKTQFITLALILLFSLTLSAKETTTVTTDEVAVSEMSQSTYEAEEALAIESWMTNDYEWNLTSASEMDVEEPLQIEGWMTNSELWNRNTNKQVKLDNSNDKLLSIENWMTNDAYWNM